MERQFCWNKKYKKKKGGLQNDMDEKIYTSSKKSFPNMARLLNLLTLHDMQNYKSTIH